MNVEFHEGHPVGLPALQGRLDALVAIHVIASILSLARWRLSPWSASVLARSILRNEAQHTAGVLDIHIPVLVVGDSVEYVVAKAWRGIDGQLHQLNNVPVAAPDRV